MRRESSPTMRLGTSFTEQPDHTIPERDRREKLGEREREMPPQAAWKWSTVVRLEGTSLALLQGVEVEVAVAGVGGVLLEAAHELGMIRLASLRSRRNRGRRLLDSRGSRSGRGWGWGRRSATHDAVHDVARDGRASAEGETLSHGSAETAKKTATLLRRGHLHGSRGRGRRGRRGVVRRGSRRRRSHSGSRSRSMVRRSRRRSRCVSGRGRLGLNTMQKQDKQTLILHDKHISPYNLPKNGHFHGPSFTFEYKSLEK